VNFVSAGLDPAKFLEPQTVRLDRPEADYIYFGWGPHACPGRSIVTTAIAAMLRVFARECKNARRAPGLAGEMQKKMYHGVFPVYLTEDDGQWNSFPVGEFHLFFALPLPPNVFTFFVLL
jgi:linoleate 10R-lipoxygenase